MLHENMKILMEIKNINQIQLSKLSGISQSTISRYLRFTSYPTDENLKKLTKIFGVNEQFLTYDKHYGDGVSFLNCLSAFEELLFFVIKNRMYLNNESKLEIVKELLKKYGED